MSKQICSKHNIRKTYFGGEWICGDCVLEKFPIYKQEL